MFIKFEVWFTDVEECPIYGSEKKILEAIQTYLFPYVNSNTLIPVFKVLVTSQYVKRSTQLYISIVRERECNLSKEAWD